MDSAVSLYRIVVNIRALADDNNFRESQTATTLKAAGVHLRQFTSVSRPSSVRSG